MLAADVMVGGGVWEFMNNVDGPAFLERELVGLGVDVYRASGTVPIHVSRASDLFPQCKKLYFFTLELVYQVEGFFLFVFLQYEMYSSH